MRIILHMHVFDMCENCSDFKFINTNPRADTPYKTTHEAQLRVFLFNSHAQ